MNSQLRELLCRIPCSPETDELQDFLVNYEREFYAQSEQRNRLAFALEDVLSHFRNIAGDCDIEDQRNDELASLANAERALALIRPVGKEES